MYWGPFIIIETQYHFRGSVLRKCSVCFRTIETTIFIAIIAEVIIEVHTLRRAITEIHPVTWAMADLGVRTITPRRPEAVEAIGFRLEDPPKI